MSKTTKLIHRFIFISVLIFGVSAAGNVCASQLVTQTWLPGDCIPQFVLSLPVFGPAGPIPRVDAVTHSLLTINFKEIEQSVLPPFSPKPG